MSDFVLAWHPYHADFLVGVITSIADRLAEIHASKPSSEWPLRERLMKAVVGKLPEELVRAGAELNRARAEVNRVWVELDRAWAEQNRARDEWDRVYSIALPEIEALHAIECPDCPRDGNSIFEGMEP